MEMIQRQKISKIAFFFKLKNFYFLISFKKKKDGDFENNFFVKKVAGILKIKLVRWVSFFICFEFFVDWNFFFLNLKGFHHTFETLVWKIFT